MFDPALKPRVFGVAPGVDFPRALIEGLLSRHIHRPPQALARVQIIVNTARMERRIRQIFDEGPARLLPKLHLVTRLDQLEPGLALPQAANPLRRRLELISLVGRLIDTQPGLAPRSALYALTDSLAGLIDEMQGEGVTADEVLNLEVSDHSAHWQRAQQFIAIAHSYLEQADAAPDAETRQRQLVEALVTRWADAPPNHPVIMAGSTGSRGTTLMLMEAIARLPGGAIVLPGFDFQMPQEAWSDLDTAMTAQDHPQYRFRNLMSRLDLAPEDVAPWHGGDPGPVERNALVSIALRPAPVTHVWLTEGPGLRDLETATRDVTLLEAPSPRVEALTIALRLRAAVEHGQKAAVITPDRMLTRQITAALQAWDILPDDSAGSPLHLSPPGRFLRHVADLFLRRLDAEGLLTLLKHPLTHSERDRGDHVMHVQRLELRIRRDGLPYPEADSLRAAVLKSVHSEDRRKDAAVWCDWVCSTFCEQQTTGSRPLSDWVARHIALAEAICAGTDGTGSGELWLKKAGQKAREVMDTLIAQSAHGQPMTAADYATLVGALLAEGEVRDRDAPHPGVMIWGTMEARVQGADLVILAGLNEGTWPEAPAPDPWLNRAMRNKAGLLLPDRRIGLSAHDFQQAVASPEVWITRAIRSEDAQTVPSRWLNRLCNLLEGLKVGDGPACLKAMRARGSGWLSRAEAYEHVQPARSAQRPAPRPPVAARPRQLAVTDIKHLIRDPYAIYAKHVLRLRKLGPLVQTADALTRGTVLHEVMEDFVRHTVGNPADLTAAHLVKTAQNILASDVPWPATRALWTARVKRISEWFVTGERLRQSDATPAAFETEAQGSLTWPDLDLTLVARADRIDRTDSGSVRIYDYKTGSVPSAKQQEHFDKQLLIEAAMLEEGGFAALGTAPVERAVFIGLSKAMEEVEAPFPEAGTTEILRQLHQLLTAYNSQSTGYVARRMMQEDRFESDYDLLSRHGEWDISCAPVPEDLR